MRYSFTPSSSGWPKTCHTGIVKTLGSPQSPSLEGKAKYVNNLRGISRRNGCLKDFYYVFGMLKPLES